MTGFSANGAAWLRDQSQQDDGVAAAYTRGAYTASGTPVVYQNDHEVMDDANVVTVVTSIEVIWDKEALILNGTRVDPRTGDQITTTFCGESVTLEVMPIGKRKEWEPHDAYGKTILIHTKRVA